MVSKHSAQGVGLSDLAAYCWETLAAKLLNHIPRDVLAVHDLRQQYEEEKVLKSLNAHKAVSSQLSVPSSSSEVSEATTPSSLASSNTSTSLSKGLGKEGSLPLFKPEDEYALFVTYETIVGDGEHDLRGCIGTFQAQPLKTALAEYAEIAAFQDTRFEPISEDELPELTCSVTLLTDFETCKDPFDWRVGTHGIRIKFGSHYGATFLPSVAIEQNWTQIETLRHLVRKAGLRGPFGKSRTMIEGADQKWVQLLKSGSVVRYQGKKGRMDYTKWKRWSDWADARARQ